MYSLNKLDFREEPLSGSSLFVEFPEPSRVGEKCFLTDDISNPRQFVSKRDHNMRHRPCCTVASAEFSSEA